MLRRCVSEISTGRSMARKHVFIRTHTPFFLYSRNEFATSVKKSSQVPYPLPPPPPQEPSNSGSALKKLALGGVIIGGAFVAAYQTDYLGTNIKDDKFDSNVNLETDPIFKHNEESNVHTPAPSMQNQVDLEPNMENVDITKLPETKDLDVNQETEAADKVIKDSDLAKLIEEIQPVLDQRFTELEGKSNTTNDAKISLVENKQPEDGTVESSQISEDGTARDTALHHDTTIELPKDPVKDETYTRPALADSYFLHEDEHSHEKRDEIDAIPFDLSGKKVTVDENERPKDIVKKDDNKITLDLIETIHAAERRQLEVDTYKFAEEIRKTKEKYETELKDSRIRELRDTEELAMLEKELKKEKAKAEATIKLLQEKAEQKLLEELQRKEEEANMQLKKAQDLAKAELAAAIAREKASQIEKISEADTNISALCMAFYARSEETRQSHSIHRLALGTLALKNSLSKGLPFKAEVEALHKSLEDKDKDSLIDLVLASLPEEALNHGTDTPMQLNQKFESLKGTLRHFSLIPAGGGGLLTHAVAHVASSLKVKEDGGGDGIEAVISKVEKCLSQGKYAEAAETIEAGVRGTEAQQIVLDFAKQARYRAVAEQALSVLQSYAISVSSS